MIKCGAMVTVVQLILLMLVQLSMAEDYCNLECKSDHTMCKYTKDEPAETCQMVQRGLSENQKKEIVSIHNKLRHKVATGKEQRGKPGPQPPTKSRKMPTMKWDNEIAMMAQRWADQCHFDHDICRDVRRFTVGQNLAVKGSTLEDKFFTIEEMVMLWYDEVKDVSRHDLDPFKFHHNTGHYSQLVWGNSTLIGCGSIRYIEEEFYKFYLVCNYAPAGNVISYPIYDFKASPKPASSDTDEKNLPHVLMLVFSAFVGVGFFN